MLPRMSIRPSDRPSGPPSVCPRFVSRADLGNLWMDLFNFTHTHPLRGLYVPFGIFEVSPTQLGYHQP